MNTQYKPTNPLYNPQIIGGSQTDILCVLTRNRDVSTSFGEHQKGYIYIDETPSQDILKNTKYIKVLTGHEELIDGLPKWIYETQHISVLSASIDLFLDNEFINSDFIQNLEVLELLHSSNNEIMIDIDCSKLPNLKRLVIMAYNHNLINTECLKKIEVFSINLEDRVKDELSKIKFLPKVKVLGLESISTKLDLSPLSELKPTGLSVKFNFHKKQSLLSIINRRELEYLFINNTTMPIDFEVFADAKHLKEITIWNSKKFENIATIGNISSLRSLDISYGKFNPTEEEKAIIDNMNLDYLKIV